MRATLTAAIPPTAPAFNGTFFTVAVSVIPILYLAVAVQSELYANLMNLGWRSAVSFASRQSLKKLSAFKYYKTSLTLRLYLLPVFAVATAAAIVFFGVVGEILGLLSLYWQRDVGTPWLTFMAVAFLTLAAAGGPITVIIKPAKGIVPLFWFDTRAPFQFVVAAIISNRRVLLVQDAATGWKFPSGSAFRGETMAAAAVRHAAAAAPYMVVSARRWLGQEFDIKKGVHMIEYVACIPDSYDELTLDEEDISLGDGISQLAWCSFTELSTKLSEPMFGPLKRYLETNLKP